MFHKSPSGRVALSLSVDSSCHNQLISPWQGFESLNLTPFRSPAPPTAIFGKSCTFPNWSQGEWQDIKITENQIEFRDETTDQVHSGFCLSEEDPRGERFTIGVETYSCIWLKSRSDNVLEFIILQ
ncbi:hypothetical protein Anas_14457 [Armadillidium nasatum]|uniref:DUF7043 domain-containing protein n=1 Tax=Armadillidium nasatum TaxID=96803 RepID=A0A5N5T426_9CRUS|nr:hypothetical protein Anas_14457 [Armadillidium nasatum]